MQERAEVGQQEEGEQDGVVAKAQLASAMRTGAQTQNPHPPTSTFLNELELLLLPQHSIRIDSRQIQQQTPTSLPKASVVPAKILLWSDASNPRDFLTLSLEASAKKMFYFTEKKKINGDSNTLMLFR